MSVETGPNIVNSDLVFNMDASNIRSFQGVARTNLARGVNFSSNNTNGTYYKYTQGTEVVDIPQVGKRTVKYVDHWNDYSGGSGNCCPNLFYYHDGWVSVSGSTTYTYSLIYKTTTGYTHPNFMYRYEYVNSSTYVTEGGVHNDNNRTHLGDGWYYAWGQFTTQPTTNTLVLYLFYYQYATWDRIYVDRASLVAGSTVPDVKHITAYNSTNSGNWTDTTGGYTGTLTNGPTYDSANGGSIVFDGSNDTVNLPASSLTTTQNFTAEAWVKLSLRGDRHIVLVNWTGWAIEVGQSGSALYPYFTWWNGSAQLSTTWNLTATVGGWTHLCATFDGSTARIYVNGTQSAQYNSTTISYSVYARQISGTTFSGPILGNVASVRNYNVALTAAEVTQNFNATRARFGV